MQRKTNQKPAVPDQLVACYLCHNHLDFVFVYQSCQHAVCARCARNARTETYCQKCGSGNTLYQSLGLYTGSCKQFDALLLAHDKARTQRTRESLQKNEQNAYAQALIAQNPLPLGLSSRLSRAPKPEKKRKTRRGCCATLCCIPCQLFSATFSFLKSLIVTVAIWVAFIVVLSAVLLGVDSIFPGTWQRIEHIIDNHPTAFGLLLIFFVVVYFVLRLITNRLWDEADLLVNAQNDPEES